MFYVYYIDIEDCEQTNDVEKGDAEKIECAETGEPEEIEGAEMGQGNAPLAEEDLKDQVCFYSTVHTYYGTMHIYVYICCRQTWILVTNLWYVHELCSCLYTVYVFRIYTCYLHCPGEW